MLWRMKRLAIPLWALNAALWFGGCVKHDHSDQGHHHEAPHGGVLLALGDHEFNLEFVRDNAAGTLTAYVLTAHTDDFVRIPAKSFQITAQLPGREEDLVLKAVANSATGETAGNTAQFQAQAEWLKTASDFDVLLKELAIKGKRYQSIAFKLPK